MKLLLPIAFIFTFLLSSGPVFSGAADPMMQTTDTVEVSVKVYPNPVTEGYFNVSSDTEINKIEILSLLGQRVVNKRLEPSFSVRLNTSDLQSGIYLIKIYFRNEIVTTRRIWID